MALGPVMVGIEGQTLTACDIKRLQHPNTGGVILFARNFSSAEQISVLTDKIHALRHPQLIIAVDQEGGRVQRFREGFTRLPPVRQLGAMHDLDPHRAKHLARASGWLMAAELRAVGIDVSFAPVMDLDHGCSQVIGDRAFHHDPDVVADLAFAYESGMRQAGMEACAKHFPGHGAVMADSHHDLPVDARDWETLRHHDLHAFSRFCHHGGAAVMAAHVIYPAIAPEPASFSSHWLRHILRQELGFNGAVLSDDLDMAAAAVAGTPARRARAALNAGCDMILVCNNFDAMDETLAQLPVVADPLRQARLMRLHGRGHLSWNPLHHQPRWKNAHALVTDYDQAPWLTLDI